MAERESLRYPSRGAGLEMRSDFLARQDRRTRNLATDVRGVRALCDFIEVLSTGYSFRYKRPHFVLKRVVNSTRLSRGCASDATNPRVKIPYESRQSKGCISKSEAYRRTPKPIRTRGRVLARRMVFARLSERCRQHADHRPSPIKAIWLSFAVPNGAVFSLTISDTRNPAHCLQTALANSTRSRSCFRKVQCHNDSAQPVAPPNCILCDGPASPHSRMGWLQAPDRQAVFCVCGRCSDCTDTELEAKIVAQR